MKPNSFKIVSLFILTFFTIQISAQNISIGNTKDSLQKSTKKYSKTYSLNGENVVLQNKFGQMIIETWDKNEIQVDAEITVGTEDKIYSTLVLSKIYVFDEKKTDSIKFETRMEDFNNDENNYHGNQNIKIDYVVHLPSNAKLVAQNSFGLLSIADYKGEAEITSRHGALKAGNLSNVKSIKVEFGRAVIESVNNTKLDFRHSKIEVKNISGNIEANLEFCNSIDFVVTSSLKKLDIDAKHTSMYLALENGVSIDYNISTNNATVNSKMEYKIEEEKKAETTKTGSSFASYKPVATYNLNHKYSGSIGKSGGTQIKIKSDYGNIKVI